MNTLTIALFALWITKWFSPIQAIKDDIIEAYTEYCIHKGLFGLQKLALVLTCPMCFGFWFTLFYKQDFWMALSVSALAFVFNFIYDKINEEYER